MKRAAFLAVVLAGGFFADRHFSGDDVEARYRAFADEILHRRYDAAAEMADGLTAADLDKLGSQERIGGGPPMFLTLFPSRFVVESRTSTPDGFVVLPVIQTVLDTLFSREP